MQSIVQGVIMSLVALLGLYLSSRAIDSSFALFAGLLFLFGIIGIFVTIHKSTGKPSK